MPIQNRVRSLTVAKQVPQGQRNTWATTLTLCLDRVFQQCSEIEMLCI